MNIFFLDIDPKTCAQFHCDKHVVKMITEYSQLLSTSYRLRHPKAEVDVLYQVTHENHPMVKWLLKEISHRHYLLRLLNELIEEYDYRFMKPSSFIRARAIVSNPQIQSWGRCDLIDWDIAPQCMPQFYKSDDLFLSYRAYYIGEKLNFAKWTKRELPYWWPLSSLDVIKAVIDPMNVK